MIVASENLQGFRLQRELDKFLCLLTNIDQPIVDDILLGQIAHIYEIDAAHVIGKRKQIDGQLYPFIIRRIVNDA